MIFHLYRHQNPLVILDAHGTSLPAENFVFHLSDLLRKIDRVSYGLLGKKQLEAGDLWRGIKKTLGGGFKYFLFSPLFGEDSHFDSDFSNGLKPPTRNHLHPRKLTTPLDGSEIR